jgi:hypothetical protein
MFTVLRPAQEFFIYMETSPLPVKGCKILAYARRSRPLCREGSLSCHTCCLGFSGLIRRTAPFSRLLRHTRGCGGSILTRILMGPTIEERGNLIHNHQSHKSCRKNKSENSVYTRGWIRCLRGVSIPCRQVTAAMIPISRSCKRNNSPSKSVS